MDQRESILPLQYKLEHEAPDLHDRESLEEQSEWVLETFWHGLLRETAIAQLKLE